MRSASSRKEERIVTNITRKQIFLINFLAYSFLRLFFLFLTPILSLPPASTFTLPKKKGDKHFVAFKIKLYRTNGSERASLFLSRGISG